MFAELFLNANAALDAMMAAGAFDRWAGRAARQMPSCTARCCSFAWFKASHIADACRNVTLAPVTFGLDVPEWYQPLLEPYTRHRVRLPFQQCPVAAFWLEGRGHGMAAAAASMLGSRLAHHLETRSCQPCHR